MHPQFLDPRLPEHFWSKCIPEPNSGCWLWFAASTHGYGICSLGGGGRQERAHCVTFMFWFGPVPDGLELDHLCRTRCCVNPAHLEPVTRRENLLRGDTVVARAARATHCPRGHAYDTENTRINVDKRGRKSRQCRTCDREKKRVLRIARMEAAQ